MNKTQIQKFEKRIAKIEARNKKVESDKAWETSISRKILIAILTYIIIVLFFIFAKLPDPGENAVVPTVAFFISTLSTPLFRKIWQRFLYKK